MKKLVNLLKTHQVLNIPHNEGCEDNDGEDCLCQLVTSTVSVELEDGTTGTKDIARRLPGALTLLGREQVEIPDWVAESAPVKDGVAARRLRLVEV